MDDKIDQLSIDGIEWLINGLRFFQDPVNLNHFYGGKKAGEGYNLLTLLNYLSPITEVPSPTTQKLNEINRALNDNIAILNEKLKILEYPKATTPQEIVEAQKLAEVSEAIKEASENPTEESKYRAAESVKQFTTWHQVNLEKQRVQKEEVVAKDESKVQTTVEKAAELNIYPTDKLQPITYSPEEIEEIKKVFQEIESRGPKEFNENLSANIRKNLPPSEGNLVSDETIGIASLVTTQKVLAFKEYYETHGELPKEIIDPNENLRFFLNPEDAQLVLAIPNQKVRQELSNYAAEALITNQHDINLSENLAAIVFGSTATGVIFKQQETPGDFSISGTIPTEVEKIRSVLRFDPDKWYESLQRNASIKNSVVNQIRNYDPELLKQISQKSLNEMVRVIVKNNTAMEKTLGFLFRGGESTLLKNPILGYSFGGFANVGLMITQQEGVTVLSFGLQVGGKTLGSMNIGALFGQKVVAKAAEKAIEVAVVEGATEAAVGAAAGAEAGAAAGAVGGPLAIITAIVGAIAGALIVPAVTWVQKHKEDFLMLLMAPLLLAGMFFGSPILIGASIFGGLGALAAKAGGKTISGGVGGALKTVVGSFTSLVAGVIGVPLIAACIGLPLLIAFILFIINSGAYMVPPGSFASLNQPIVSPYLKVVKTANPSGPFQNSNLPLTITYTIQVLALKETLSNIQIKYNCSVVKEGTVPNCPNLPAKFLDDLTPPSTLPPTKTFDFTYTLTYKSPDFEDSAVTDVFTVTATTSSGQTAEAAGSATIKIGKPPENCPSIWPTDSGYITEGAFAPSCSHSSLEAIDIGVAEVPVHATHKGVVVTASFLSCYGNTVDIKSTCNGKDFISRYSHLKIINVRVGTPVSMGQVIGISGNSGTCGDGYHLHYDLRNYPSSTTTKYPNDPPFMMSPYIPKDIPRGCCTVPSCKTSIP